MKKIILFVLLTLIVSGCTANYEITLNGDTVKEKLTIIETDKTIFDKELDTGFTIRESFESLLDDDEFSREEYKTKSLSSEDQLGVEYTSSSAASIINSSIVNTCYSNPKVDKDGNIVTINTGSNFECYDLYDNLDTVRVVFRTNHKVISTNASSVEGDSYIWNITKDSNKEIQITYDESITKPNYILYIAIFILIVILGISIYFISKKVKNKNNI